MAAKAILILCAQALLAQCAFSQRVCRGVGLPFTLGGQAWPYTGGLMNEGLVPDPWNRGMAFDNFGFNNPGMDFAASTMVPGYEPVDPFMGEMPFFDYGYNMPLVDPMPMGPEIPFMAEPMPFMPDPAAMMMEPYPLYTDVPMMDPMGPMTEAMIMDPLFPIITEPYPIIDPTCPVPMPMPVEEFIAPARGSPTIAPSASLSVVVMDSSIQNLFENLWNVPNNF